MQRATRPTMATGTLNQYIQTVERMFRLAEGDELACLLSLRDPHVANRNLRSSDIASLVEGNCVAPLDELIICHLLCVKVIKYFIFNLQLFYITYSCFYNLL